MWDEVLLFFVPFRSQFFYAFIVLKWATVAFWASCLWKQAIFQHLQQPEKNIPVQVGQYIWKTIASAVSDENQVKKLALNLFQLINKDLGPVLSYFHPPSFAVTFKTLLACKFPTLGYFHFVVLEFSYSLKVHFMPILSICFTFL